ncbi:hypothetical protein QNI19_18655 [Cytophagaceae bacterium DM2B3-1]|uniref:Aminoglycoside phosphotransferase n=1 Tax=Xanthocytophaga flava TaxID=3048013 RepID=A0ABT7CMJ4_9BACT|nr:hypothetical protein [Xanthocytophaga flavus]MDJ1494966.1 hypothetical protein [Xanthocytophaga flavus]
MNLSKDILNAFTLKGECIPLSGGQHTSVRVGDFVLKPIDTNIRYYEWLMTVYSAIHPKGYRLAKPVKSEQDTFVYKGWCCTRYEPGEFMNGKLPEKLEVARLFHTDVAELPFQDMPSADHKWAKAHQIAWQKEDLLRDITGEAYTILADLLSGLTLQDKYSLQIIHADLAGNIFFDVALPPLIIDFSPTIAPVAYAEAILVCDSIAWHGSPLGDLNYLSHSEFTREMILRAIVFRLTVAALSVQQNESAFRKEYKCFQPIIQYLT